MPLFLVNLICQKNNILILKQCPTENRGMERNFDNFNQFESFIRRKPLYSISQSDEIVEEALTISAEFIKEKVKEKFGHYQQGWEQLSEATKEDRVRQGYTPNDPLLRSGHLRSTVEMNVVGRSASVGSNDPIMIYQEKGTTNTGWQGAKGIPPRPVFLLTQQENGEEAVHMFVKNYIKLARGF
jgi:hypothetical protein